MKAVKIGSPAPVSYEEPQPEFATTQAPPLVPLVLRVGVTGHRPDAMKRKNPNVEAMRQAISEVLRIIKDSTDGIAETCREAFALTPGDPSQRIDRRLRIVSALASGADQWVADEAISLGYELQSPLPFPRDEYRKDFRSPREVREFDRLLSKATSVFELDGQVNYSNGDRIPDGRSYEAVGRAILNQTDILIAVWDGEPGHGLGGTGNIIQEGHRRGIPVVWIPWSAPGKWTIRLPHWRLIVDTGDLKDDTRRLRDLVHELLKPPDGSKTRSDIGTVREEYFAEHQRHGRPLLGVWILFRNVICGDFWAKGSMAVWRRLLDLRWFKVEDFVNQVNQRARQDWTTRTGPQHEPLQFTIPGNTRRWVDRCYLRHYAWANGLSMYYGNLYRSAFLVNSLLGALAVFLALVCIGMNISGKSQTIWILGEFAVILGILLLTQRGRRRNWHVRWLDYRMLAERLRVIRCASLFGGGGPQMVFAAHFSSYGNPSNTWMHWHYRAIERAAGLPNVTLSREYMESCREFWCENLLEGQRSYHAGAGERSEKMDHWLHHTGEMMFSATLIACALHILHLWVEGDMRFSWIPEHLSGWLTVASAALPALGAALATIRSQAETQRLKQRSRAMSETFASLHLAMSSIRIADESLSSVALRETFDSATDLMIRELLDWRVVFQDRPLVLPV
jgi:hypothetical protein